MLRLLVAPAAAGKQDCYGNPADRAQAERHATSGSNSDGEPDSARDDPRIKMVVHNIKTTLDDKVLRCISWR